MQQLSLFTQWKPYEVLWLCSFTGLGILIAITQQDNWFNLAVLLSGILCVILAAKGNILNYIFGIFNSCAYGYLCYTNGLYGEMALNILFYLPTAIIGFILWHKHTQQLQLTTVKRLRPQQIIFIISIGTICTLVLGYFLNTIASQNNPFLDATTNSIAIIATILMMLRYQEQWIFYILLNILTLILWLLRTLDGSGDGIMMLLMWSAFLINACYGYWNWHHLAKKSQHMESI